VLVRIGPGDEARVSSFLSAKLNFRFVSFAGAEVAPLTFSTPASGGAADFGDLVVTAGGIYQVTGTDELPSASEAFVSSFSTSVFPGLELMPAGGVADVTGYARVSPMGPSSGPFTVDVQGERLVALAATIDSLPSGPAPDCLEDEVAYKIVFRPSAAAPADYEVVGHGCEEAVVASEGGTSLVPRQDTHCYLFDALAEILPANATGTLDDPECKGAAKPPDGTVSGWLVTEGGPAPGGRVGQRGVVVLQARDEGLAYPLSTRPGGAFSVSVPPATYSVTGTSPKVLSDGKEMRCSALHPVLVRPHGQVHDVDVVCNIR
jgi:hypothetical protein